MDVVNCHLDPDLVSRGLKSELRVRGTTKGGKFLVTPPSVVVDLTPSLLECQGRVLLEGLRLFPYPCP